MKTVSYKDPYDKVPVVIQIEDDEAEGLEEVIHFLNDNARIIENLEHKERYHTAYHTKDLSMRALDYASDKDVVSDIARARYLREHKKVLYFNLLVSGKLNEHLVKIDASA